MTKLSLPLLPLILWSIVSLAVFIVGIGFAGGIDHISGPPEGELVSTLLWLIGWIFMIAPFPLLFLHFLAKRRAR